MRPPRPVVLRVLAAADPLHRHELVGVVAGDVVQIAGLEVVSLDVDMVRVIGDAEASPGDAVGDRLVHLRADELVAVSLEDDHILGFHTGRLEPIDHREHQLGRAVCKRVTDGVHLDADHVAGLEEGAPGPDRVVGAGQLFHPAVDGALDRLAVLDAGLDHGRVAHLDDLAGVRAGDAEPLGRPRALPRLLGRGVEARDEGEHGA